MAITEYVPRVEREYIGIICLILGIVMLGGIGTIIAGVKDGRNVGRDVIFGIVQLVLAPIGHIWGLVWGILIFVNSK